MDGFDQEQYGCGACAAPKKKFAGRRGVASTETLDRMVDKYAVLRDTLARKHIKDPTKDTSVTKKYGARRHRRSVGVAKKRVSGTRARKTKSPSRRRSTKKISYGRYH